MLVPTSMVRHFSSLPQCAHCAFIPSHSSLPFPFLLYPQKDNASGDTLFGLPHIAYTCTFTAWFYFVWDLPSPTRCWTSTPTPHLPYRPRTYAATHYGSPPRGTICAPAPNTARCAILTTPDVSLPLVHQPLLRAILSVNDLLYGLGGLRRKAAMDAGCSPIQRTHPLPPPLHLPTTLPAPTHVPHAPLGESVGR